MADIVKQVNRFGTERRNQRHQTFTEADAGAGDVIMVKESLAGKHATKVTIDASGGAMTVRFNVYQKLYPQRGPNMGMDEIISGSQPNVSDARLLLDESSAVISIGSGEVLSLDDDMPVKDIQIVTAAGAFQIVCI